MYIKVNISLQRELSLFPALWHRVRGKIKTSERSAETISLMKPTTGLANNKLALVTEKPAAGNEKLLRLVTSTPGLATHWIGYWLGWSLATEAGN